MTVPTITAQTITPTPFLRADVSMLDAVTVYMPEHGYHTVNAPRAIFEGKSGFTVQGQTKDTTVTSKSDTAGIVSFIYKGETYKPAETGWDSYMGMVLDVLNVLGL